MSGLDSATVFPVLALLAYGAALYWLAARTERTGIPAHMSRFVYPLSLAVYCTSWTFFGSVGTAATSGWAYVAIFAGPIILYLAAPAFLSKIARKTADGRASSLSDFIGQRFGRSRGLAALVAVAALLATAPYLALQLRIVTTSFEAMIGVGNNQIVTGLMAFLLGIFAISFGAKRKEVTGRNPGLVVAIAAENMVKLSAFVLLGLLALWFLWQSPQTATEQAWDKFQGSSSKAIPLEFIVQALLSGLAFLCLPRQFMLAFVEAPEPKSVVRARWPFLGYLGIVALMTVPIVLASYILLPSSTEPDHLLFELTQLTDGKLFLFLAFLLGVSATTSMIVTETLALSTMAANDLLAPLLIRARLHENGDLGHLMLQARRFIIMLILGGAWAYANQIGEITLLASIGYIAFAGVAQFAPAIIGSVWLGFENERAARFGLLTGLGLWAYCLFWPSLGDLASFSDLPYWLHPHSLLGFDLGSSLVHGTLISLGGNILVLLLVARFGPAPDARTPHDGRFGHVTTLGELTALVGRFVGDRVAEVALAQYGSTYSPISGGAAHRAEQLMADVIGAPSARLIVSSTLAGASLGVDEVVRLLDRSGQSLQFSRNLLEATLQTIDPGVSVIDRNLRLVAWNQRYLNLFEYPEGLVEVGRPVADLIRFNARRGECGPGDVEDHVARRLHHLSRGLPHSFERKRPSGRWIRIVGAPMPGGGYVMSFTDVTANKAEQAELETRVAERTADLAAANAALAEAKSQAEAATREKTRFLAAASHDLLQPLHAARLFLSALERQTPEAARPLLENSVRSIAAADSLLRALLDVSKLDAGGIVPTPTRFSAAGLVEELGQEFLPLAAEKGLTLLTRSTQATIETDRQLLRSILMNFLSNALRYTSSGRVSLTARLVRGKIRFSVADTGQGIPQDAQKRIFREFERLDGSAPGVGLGLAIVERTARLLGTQVRLRSTFGVGSIFTIDVPLARKPKQIGRLTSSNINEATGHKPVRILCVDDDPAILEGLASALIAQDKDPLLASSAAEALSIARTEMPDAAILDFHLGEGEDGLTLAERLRSKKPDLKIALVSAELAVRSDPRLHNLGLKAFTKPVDPQALFAYLDEE